MQERQDWCDMLLGRATSSAAGVNLVCSMVLVLANDIGIGFWDSASCRNLACFLVLVPLQWMRQMSGASTRPESQRALPPASMRLIAGPRTSAAARLKLVVGVVSPNLLRPKYSEVLV